MLPLIMVDLVILYIQWAFQNCLSITTNDEDDGVHFGACLSYIQALKSCKSRSDCYIVIWGIPH
jgi:hypothetical protein